MRRQRTFCYKRRRIDTAPPCQPPALPFPVFTPRHNQLANFTTSWQVVYCRSCDYQEKRASDFISCLAILHSTHQRRRPECDIL